MIAFSKPPLHDIPHIRPKTIIAVESNLNGTTELVLMETFTAHDHLRRRHAVNETSAEVTLDHILRFVIGHFCITVLIGFTGNGSPMYVPNTASARAQS
jgi:hypothetical protein